MTESVTRFFNAWRDGDAEAQMAVLSDVLAPQIRYADPRTETPLEGVAAVAGYVAQFAQMAPGAVANVIDLQSRDVLTRATVEFAMPGGMVQLGQYIAEMDAEGRLTRLVGFKGVGTDK